MGLTIIEPPGDVADRSEWDEEEKVRLYRAVLTDELVEIVSTGLFRNPAGIDVKYFSATPEGTAFYAKQAYRAWPEEGPYTLVETAAPLRLLTAEMLTTVDGGILTVVILTEHLVRLRPPVIHHTMPIPPG